ncbi:hypothetical protein [Shewanella acanthi]|uniref:hypothetical protein n=1 Tax=Shewanella acanthi TaxID=2864212 RepID=UPI001C654CF4|nr:hypothetical protein [Shewanella acanthi]QYJ79763.1 hypothetical protein K0H61_04875 [Shewanella acanthi]
MQIQPSFRTTNSTSIYQQNANKPSTNAEVNNVASSTVTISTAAKQFAEVDPMPLPTVPDLSGVKETAENFIALQTSIMKYQVASDMTNIAMGTSDGISASTAYYLNHNDAARAATVNQMANHQQASLLQTYVDASKPIDEWA